MLRNCPLIRLPAGCQLFDELAAARAFVRPIPWLDKLTLHQKARVVEIKSYAQYDNDWASLVDEWMDTWPLLSLDTESAIGSPLPSTVQVTFGRSMWAIILCVDSLCAERRAWEPADDDITLMEILPSRLVRWLRHSNSYILVSGAAKEAYFPGVSSYDIQDLMYNHCSSFKYSDPQVQVLDCAKTGLAIIGMVASGYTHKPIKKKVAQRWFTHLMARLPEREGKWHGYSKWPVWRLPAILYQWRVSYDVAAWYMVQDVWTPLSFLYLLVQHQLQLHCQEGPYSNAWAWSTIREVLSSHRSKPKVCLEGFKWSIPVWEWDTLQERHTVTSSQAIELSTSTPSRREYSSAAGTSSSSQLGYEVEATPSSQPGKRKRPDEEQDQENARELPGVFARDSELERPYKRRKRGHFYEEPLVLSVKMRAQNARVMYLEMGQRCGFCGGCHHAYAFGRAQVACPYVRAALSHSGALSFHPRCTYARCEIRHLHYTRVCPTLHALCPLCELRGHVGKCFVSEPWVERALEDFEAVADEGVYTSRCHLEPSWGFYPSMGTSAEPSYADLLMMDPFQAYTHSKTLCERRITTTKLWCSDHQNAALFHLNHPKQYDLRQ